METEPPTIPPELRSTICPNCGYSLAGIGDNGKCPECGRPRNPSEIVLYGFGEGDREAVGTVEKSRLAGLIIPRTIAIVVALYFFRIIGRWLAAATVLELSLQLLLRVDRQHPGALQVRIYPAGVVQFNHGSVATSLARIRVAWLWTVPAIATLALIASFFLQADTVTFVLQGVAVVVFAINAYFLGLQAIQYRRRSRALSDNAIADANLAIFPLTPWSQVSRVWLQPKGVGRYRLQLVRRYHFFSKGSRRDIVDAEIQLDDAVAPRLRALLLEHATVARNNQIFEERVVRKSMEKFKSKI